MAKSRGEVSPDEGDTEETGFLEVACPGTLRQSGGWSWNLENHSHVEIVG